MRFNVGTLFGTSTLYCVMFYIFFVSNIEVLVSNILYSNNLHGGAIPTSVCSFLMPPKSTNLAPDKSLVPRK